MLFLGIFFNVEQPRNATDAVVGTTDHSALTYNFFDMSNVILEYMLVRRCVYNCQKLSNFYDLGYFSYVLGSVSFLGSKQKLLFFEGEIIYLNLKCYDVTLILTKITIQNKYFLVGGWILVK
jgi:hypothetical protein